MSLVMLLVVMHVSQDTTVHPEHRSVNAKLTQRRSHRLRSVAELPGKLRKKIIKAEGLFTHN